MKRIVLPTQEDGNQKETQNDAPSPTTASSAVPRGLTKQTQPPSPELMEILFPSLKVGAIAGTCGLLVGAAGGIVRSAPTWMFSILSGGQWFTLGTSFYAARQVGLRHFGDGEQKPSDKVKASTVGGGVAGAVGGLLSKFSPSLLIRSILTHFRGPRSIIPGAVMFSLFGAGGQAIANWRAAKAANAPPSTGQGFWSRWSPIKALTDEDYVNLLEDKLLRVEADIAIVDEHIKELRESASQPKKAQYQEPSASNPPSSKQP